MKKREVNPNVDASNGYQNDQRMHFQLFYLCFSLIAAPDTL
jgi:hypothetical protein